MANLGLHHPRTAGADAGTLVNNHRIVVFYLNSLDRLSYGIWFAIWIIAHSQRFILKVNYSVDFSKDERSDHMLSVPFNDCCSELLEVPFNDCYSEPLEVLYHCDCPTHYKTQEHNKTKGNLQRKR